MGIEARMEELAREKGLKTKKQVEEERLNKIKDEKKTRRKHHDYYNILRNKNVVITFIDGEKLTGVLKSFNLYELCLQTEEIDQLIIHKHAIKYLHEKLEEVNQ